MSSAKRTPRYVDRIDGSRATSGLASTTPSSSAEVIPIRPDTPRSVEPVRIPRRPATPVARRPWQFLLIPATPGAPTRSFEVARWQARFLASLGGLILLLATAAVAAVVLAVEYPDAVMPSEEAATLRAQLAATQDSLTQLRAAADGGDAPGEAPAIPSALPGTKGTASRVGSRPVPGIGLGVAHARLLPADGLPVVGAIVSTFSFSRRHPILHIRRPHLGVDVAAPRGTPISAPAEGTVTFVGRRFAFGLVVEVDHGQGMVTRYAHMRSAAVEEGQRVAKGALIGAVGSSGLTTGPHLHYEVLVNGRQVDPLRAHLPGPTP